MIITSNNVDNKCNYRNCKDSITNRAIFVMKKKSDNNNSGSNNNNCYIGNSEQKYIETYGQNNKASCGHTRQIKRAIRQQFTS